MSAARTRGALQFPYYELADRRAMYIYGSVFYGIYFLFSFPMFLRCAPRARTCVSVSPLLWASGCNDLVPSSASSRPFLSHMRA